MIYQGKLVGKGLKIAIVVSRFNEFIGKKLLEGSLDALQRHEVKEDDIDVIREGVIRWRTWACVTYVGIQLLTAVACVVELPARIT